MVSKGEQRILSLATQGMTDKEIAKELGLSMTTVRTHWVRVRRKMGVANKAEAVWKLASMAGEAEIAVHRAREGAARAVLLDLGYAIWEWSPDCGATLDSRAQDLFGIQMEAPVSTAVLLSSFAPEHRAAFRRWLEGSFSAVGPQSITHVVNVAAGSPTAVKTIARVVPGTSVRGGGTVMCVSMPSRGATGQAPPSRNGSGLSGSEVATRQTQRR